MTTLPDPVAAVQAHDAAELKLIAKGKLIAIADMRRMLPFAPSLVAADHILIGMTVEATLEESGAR